MSLKYFRRLTFKKGRFDDCKILFLCDNLNKLTERIIKMNFDRYLNKDNELNDLYQKECSAVSKISSLSEECQSLCKIVCLTSLKNTLLLKNELQKALDHDVSPLKIQEAIYQCACVSGYPSSIQAAYTFFSLLKEKGCTDGEVSAQKLNETDRFEKGRQIQLDYYGDEVAQVFASLPEPYNTFVPEFLTGAFFGDIETREFLSIHERELFALLSMACIGASQQLKPHIAGAIKAGNTKEDLLSAFLLMIPYTGFPYGMSALQQILQYDPNKSAEAYR